MPTISAFQMPKLRASQVGFIMFHLGEVIDLNKIHDDPFQILFHMITHNLVSLGICCVCLLFLYFQANRVLVKPKIWMEKFTVFFSHRIDKASLICP